MAASTGTAQQLIAAYLPHRGPLRLVSRAYEAPIVENVRLEQSSEKHFILRVVIHCLLPVN